MKKSMCLILSCLLLWAMFLPAAAAPEEPRILFQPQNYTYPEYATALYTVEAHGTNLRATWYLEWQGATYNLSDNTNGMEPWEAYAGENYGGSQDGNRFIWFFGGIEKDLSGGEIWCVIEDGHYTVTSARALITVSGTALPPEILEVPAALTASQGGWCELRAVAKSPDGSQLSYLWYETDSGKLQDIRALNRGEETSDFILPDTSRTGTRNYVCMIQTENGGVAYTSVIPVTVDAPEASQPQEETTGETTGETTEATETVETIPETTEATEAPETTGAAEPSAPTEPAKEQPPVENASGLPWLWIGLAILTALSLAVIVTILVMQKKKKA